MATGVREIAVTETHLYQLDGFSMSDKNNHYPLWLCLLITMILFGAIALIVGIVMVDWSSYPESSVQLVNWIVEQQTSQLEEPVQSKLDKMETDNRKMYNILLSLGILSIIFGLLTLLVGIDMCYSLCIQEKRNSSNRTVDTKMQELMEARHLAQSGRSS